MTDQPIVAQLNNSDENNTELDENLNSLVPGQTTEENFMEKVKRKFGKIPKTIFACLVMLLIGIIMIIIPSFTDSISKGGKIGMYIVGALLLIPSVYVVYILYKVFNDTPGYDIDGLPLWDE